MRVLAFALLLLGGCVTVEDHSRLAANAVSPNQRTIVVVYPSPGPWVVPDPDSKAEAAAKTLPGLASVVSAYQEERGLKEATDLKQYLPRWNPAPALSEALLKELPGSGYSGKLTPQAGSDLSDDLVRRFNRSADALTWQQSYFYENPERGLSRDYASVLALDDALILEVNLLPGVAGNDDGNMVPTLWASARLVRANTLRPLWKREETVEDKEAARSMYEFKTLPRQLTDKWDALVPQLAAKLSASLRESIVQPISPAQLTSEAPPASAAPAPAPEPSAAAPIPAPQ